MTLAATGGPPPTAPPAPAELARWGAAGTFVLAAHLAAAWFLYDLAPPGPPPPPALEQSLEVELALLEISHADAVESEPLPPSAPVERLQPMEAPPETLQTAAEPDRLAALASDAASPAVSEPLMPQPLQPEAIQSETVQPKTARALTPEPQQAQLLEVQPAQPAPRATAAAPAPAAPLPSVPPLAITPAPSVAAEALLPEAPDAVQALEAFPRTPETVALLPRRRPAIEKPKPQPPRKRAEPRRERAETRQGQEAAAPEQARPRRQQQREQRAARTAQAAPASAASAAARAARAPTVSPARWQQQVQARVARSVRGLRRRGFEGRVSVRFTVAPSGAVTGVRVARSSGDGALDRATVGAVSGVSVPPPPPGVGRTLTLPVVFN